jgi:DNA-binding response OmpR family regulator
VRLLIVEDEARLAAALQRGLASEGFTVDVAHTGPDGLHLAMENDYDALILDIMLPGLSGYRIIERLRAAENWVPILMLTAKDGEYDEADALDLGADDYLTKPFSVEHLSARMAAVLRRSRAAAADAPPSTVLRVGGLTVDPLRRQAELDGVRLDLTRREFDLLAFLAGRPGVVVPRKELLAEVWQQSYGDDQTIDVHLSWLRRKLGETAARPRYLHTLRGVGVKLEPPGAEPPR